MVGEKLWKYPFQCKNYTFQELKADFELSLEDLNCFGTQSLLKHYRGYGTFKFFNKLYLISIKLLFSIYENVFFYLFYNTKKIEAK
jgi:hypothetical protein